MKAPDYKLIELIEKAKKENIDIHFFSSEDYKPKQNNIIPMSKIVNDMESITDHARKTFGDVFEAYEMFTELKDFILYIEYYMNNGGFKQKDMQTFMIEYIEKAQKKSNELNDKFKTLIKNL